MPFGVDENGFRTRKFNFDRNSGYICDQRCVMLHGHIFFAAESATDQLVFYQAVLIVYAQHLRTFMESGMCALVCGKEFYAAVFQGKSNTAFRFQESVFRPWCFKVFRDDIFTVGNRFVCVTAGNMLMGLYVVLICFKHQRRVFRCSFNGIMNGGEDLVFHFDQFLRCFQRLLILSAYQCDGIAEIMSDFTDGNESRLILFNVSDIVFAGNILCRQHTDDSGKRFRFGGVD